MYIETDICTHITHIQIVMVHLVIGTSRHTRRPTHTPPHANVRSYHPATCMSVLRQQSHIMDTGETQHTRKRDPA